MVGIWVFTLTFFQLGCMIENFHNKMLGASKERQKFLPLQYILPFAMWLCCSSHKEVGSTSRLHLSCPCDLLWPKKYMKVTLGVLSLGHKRPDCFSSPFLAYSHCHVNAHRGWEHTWREKPTQQPAPTIKHEQNHQLKTIHHSPNDHWQWVTQGKTSLSSSKTVNPQNHFGMVCYTARENW